MKTELENLVNAIEGLSKMKDGKTLFEGLPTKDRECCEAWLLLNTAMHDAKIILGQSA